MKPILLGLTVGILFAYHVGGVVARDLDGRYADSPLHDWFNHLASGRGLCCSMADGETLADPVGKKGRTLPCPPRQQMVDVPDEAVITGAIAQVGRWSGVRFDEQI
jgi:hypothetical protein